MAEIDCWRLLGISPPATADEVQAAFAKRARDVHPDSGGTGDSLTMSLLVDARDEALAQIGESSGTDPEGSRRQSRGYGATDHGRQAGRSARAGSSSSSCYVCQESFPPGRLYENRIYQGFRGRPKSGMVLMCIACACQVEAEYAKRKRLGAIYAIAALTFIVIAGLLLLVLAML
jgi:hypothetical protein